MNLNPTPTPYNRLDFDSIHKICNTTPPIINQLPYSTMCGLSVVKPVTISKNPSTIIIAGGVLARTFMSANLISSHYKYHDLIKIFKAYSNGHINGHINLLDAM